MSLSAVASMIGNALGYPDGKPFAAILGASPSKGARSPVLWNAAFKAHGIDAQMLPMDVTGERLAPLLEALETNPDFLGGAIAMPHKETVARWLADRLTEEAKAIGAVNCLYRSADGRLLGTNTDGEGALASYQSQFGSLSGKSVLLLGPGGAGKAVAAYMARALGPTGRLTIVSRKVVDYARLGAVACIDWKSIDILLPAIDVLVNCTSIGAAAQVGLSPLSGEQLAVLPTHAAVFDIIYEPRPTSLLKLAQDRGLRTFDGTRMNLEQAVLAFGYALKPSVDSSATRQAMEGARVALG